MYICNTKKGNVRKALKNLIDSHDAKTLARSWDRGNVPAVLQVNVKNYDHLKTLEFEEMLKQAKQMLEQVGQRDPKYIINLNTLTVHKKDCPYTGRVTIKAALINLRNTGLHICKHC